MMWLTKREKVIILSIKCVILNACFSEAQADSIAEQIEYVIGISAHITDEAAIRFASSFYQALGFGKDVPTAFQSGCLELDLHNLGEENIPKLIIKKTLTTDAIISSSSSNNTASDGERSSFLLRLNFDADGNVTYSDAELTTLAGDTIYAVENGDRILYEINYEGLAAYQSVLNIPLEELSPAQRAYRPEYLKHLKHLKKQLLRCTEMIEVILAQPVYFHIIYAYGLMDIFRGLGWRCFRRRELKPSANHVGLDLYFGENPAIYTVIHFDRSNDDDTNYYQFLGGGWDLYDLPNYVRFQYAIPAIVAEYLRLREKVGLTELPDILNLYQWKVGLR